MEQYNQFHDGSFNGLLIEGKSVWLFVATERRKKFRILASGVVAFAAEGFRAGNIIFDVLIRRPEQIGVRDVELAYGLVGDDSSQQKHSLLENARSRGLTVLEITPSYGATCVLLAASFELISE